jgi:hypothetical protein
VKESVEIYTREKYKQEGKHAGEKNRPRKILHIYIDTEYKKKSCRLSHMVAIRPLPEVSSPSAAAREHACRRARHSLSAQCVNG